MPISNPIAIAGIGAIDLSPLITRLDALEAENIAQDSAIAALQQGQQAPQSLAISTGAIGAQSTLNLALNLPKTSLLLTASTTAQCRIRLYRSADYRASDSSRAFGTAPTGEHGLILDLIHPAGNPTWDLSPVAVASNADSPRQAAIYAAIYNPAATSQSFDLTFVYLPLEV